MKQSNAINPSKAATAATLFFKRLCLLLLGGALIGCAPKVIEPPSGDVQFGVFLQITIKDTKKTDNKTPAKRFSAVWHHTKINGEEHDDLDIKGPLGNTVAKIEVTPAAAVLRVGEKSLTRPTGSELVERVFGTPIPIESFHYWITAQAAPGDAKVARGDDGNISEINQYGWIIKYLSFDDENRPERMRITNDLGWQVNLTIRRWL